MTANTAASARVTRNGRRIKNVNVREISIRAPKKYGRNSLAFILSIIHLSPAYCLYFLRMLESSNHDSRNKSRS